MNNDNIYTSSLDGSLKVYSFEKQRQVRRVTDLGDAGLSACVFYKRGETSYLAVGTENDTIYVYSLDYGKVQDTLHGHVDQISKIVQHKDILVSASFDQTIKIWRCNSSGSYSKVPEVEIEDHDSEVTALAIAPNGSMLVSGNNDGYIAIHDLTNVHLIKYFSAHSGQVTDITFLGNDVQRILSCSTDRTFRIHDALGNILTVVDINDPINCIYSEGNSILAGCNDGSIKLYDVAGKFIKSYQAHKTPVIALAVSEHGTSVVTASSDGDAVYYKYVK